MNAKIFGQLSALAVAGVLLAGCQTAQETNTAAGALGGGALGAAIGGAAGGGEGAGIGAATGMVAGALVGHLWEDVSKRLFGAGAQSESQNDGSLKVTLDGANFRSGTLTAGPHPQLAQLANELKANPSLTARLAGYADSTGNARDNLARSQARAQSVANYLTQSGVDPSQLISVTGYGATDFVADNGTARGRERNRRVVVYLNSSQPNQSSR